MVTTLADNQIFIFGSNMTGLHGGGAARQAYDTFGAEWGVGEGRTGQCYAFPTIDRKGCRRPHKDLLESLDRLYTYANNNHDLEFLLTKVGCGIAGYSEKYMSSFFASAPSNVTKPEGW